MPAPAPPQLQCHAQPQGYSGPFLVAPFTGWTDINSFVDHSSPDYTLDGEVVLANGLTAVSSDGVSSDYFPAYWSPRLRQYINYDGHNGYDFGIAYQPVQAAAAGKIMFAGWSGGYGQMILIDHLNGYVTLYGHLSTLEVNKGDHVIPGQEIGISGSTGNSSGPHLHFSVYHNCQVTDPYGWTGRGADPLFTFDGEHAGYLWLPGFEPLVLNPPPNWPAFPSGLRVSLPDTAAYGRRGVRIVPPADRLLLLKLPVLPTGQSTTAAVALARTEALITAEGEVLTPYLADLRREGLIDSYQIVPAAGAVWTRGNATAAELEGLPGVASLSGVQPADLAAAQAGLSHGVLIQLGSRQAPSLWPAGFRSSLHAWRPVLTVLARHALIAGFTLPGQHVGIVLHRGGSIVGSADAASDPETGGFVATIHDGQGNAVTTVSDDTVQVQTDGRSTDDQVTRLSVKARSRRLLGDSPAGSTISMLLLSPDGRVLWTHVVTSSSTGSYSVRPPSSLLAGTLAVASCVDVAGNLTSATGYVPGVALTVGSSTVRGWVVGAKPVLSVVRLGMILLSRNIVSAPDGSFSVVLQRGNTPIILRSGDRVLIGPLGKQRSIMVPSFGVRISVGSRPFQVWAPAGKIGDVSVAQLQRDVVRSEVHFQSSDSQYFTLGRPATAGDAATVQLHTSAGDSLSSSSPLRDIILHVGKPEVSGIVVPGSAIRIRAQSVLGVSVGTAVASADPTTGKFAAMLQDSNGTPVRWRPGLRYAIDDGSQTIVGSVPRISLTLNLSARTVRVRVAAGNQIRVVMVGPRTNRTGERRLPGSTTIAYGLSIDRDLVRSIVVSVEGPDGVRGQKTIVLLNLSLAGQGRQPVRVVPWPQ